MTLLFAESGATPPHFPERSCARTRRMFCSSCHKVHLDVPVNLPVEFAAFNEYDNCRPAAFRARRARVLLSQVRPMIARLSYARRCPRATTAMWMDSCIRTVPTEANTAVPTANQDQAHMNRQEVFAGQASECGYFRPIFQREKKRNRVRYEAKWEDGAFDDFCSGRGSRYFLCRKVRGMKSAPFTRAPTSTRTGRGCADGATTLAWMWLFARVRSGHFFPRHRGRFRFWLELSKPPVKKGRRISGAEK